MHDLQDLVRPDASVEWRLRRRHHYLDLEALRKLTKQRAEAISRRDSLRAALNKVSRTMAERPDARTPEDMAAAKGLKESIREAEVSQRAAEAQLDAALLAIPNVPSDEAPDGGPEDPPVEVQSWGRAPAFHFEPRDHVELASSAGILDLQRASKLSGARFAVFRGAGAALERALVSFFLDLHTKEHHYSEHSVPYLVNPQSMTGTGQLPKFTEDLFATQVAGRSLYLIPTAEVPLVNLYAREMIDADALPLGLTAHTACFRAEAGSYGRDTRGVIRLHQFSKVELVRFCLRSEATAQLELLLSHAEECLQRLDLHYRVVDLRAADLGFSARRTYDLEVWLPSQNCYREVSSVSDCGDFQARRAGIRVRRGKTKEYVATLNGSGLPIGRTIVAILEQNQRQDGSVEVPAALVRYTGFRLIKPDGTTEG
ncbi:serine--tRNA ligase [Streptomyces sp. Rer75]|uniref:serine--tRNA ligase n=1 Tax=Streptomyces sp. Rer75 TaxID=2750011 RepID=UPI0015D0B773|nr:serine--tRNA ligase [Streptomyces sp. Rer75]QLH19352.1 serine--tRNA ligase [Streptomyces sp. Rer75]